MVGRQEELAVVAEALANPECSGVVVAGASGVGKSRLLREALALAEAEGFATSTVVGFSATAAVPLAAFSAYPLPAVMEDEHETLQMAVHEVVKAARGRRLVLAVDDAYLLDEQSAALVHRLARGGAAFVLAAVRSGEAAPAPLVALWKDGLAERLELQSLARGEVERLLSEVLGDYVDVQLSQELWRESGGNPLFLRELVLSGAESGAIRRDGDVWRRHGPSTCGARLAEVVGERLAHLGQEERELLELLAVAGKLEVAALDHLASPGAVSRLEAHGLLEVEEDRRRRYVSVAHPLYGEALRPQLQLRGRLLRTRVADVLEAMGLRRQNDVLRIAALRLDSTSRLNTDLALAAARQAEALFDHALAERLAEAAVDGGAGFGARLMLGEAMTGMRRGIEAEHLLASLQGDARTDAERAQVSIARAKNLLFNLRDLRAAESVLSAADAVVCDPDWRDEMALLRGDIAQYDSRYAAVLEAVLPVVERAGVSDDRLVRGLSIAAKAYGSMGKMPEADAITDRALAIASRLAQPLRLSEAWLLFGKWRNLVRHNLTEAEALAVETYQRAMEEGFYEVAVLFAMPVGSSALYRGKVRTAQRRVSEALSLVRRHDVVGQQEGALVVLVEATALSGESQAAETLWGEAAQLCAFSTFEPWLTHARAWVFASRGELADARAMCRDAIASARKQEQVAAEARILHGLVRLGVVSDETVSRFDDLLLDGPMMRCYAAHARAALAGDGDRLNEVASWFERIGANLLAAEAAAQAAGCYRQQGRSAQARKTTSRAEALLARCEGARTPAVAGLGEDPTQRLTQRQRYIATLAASGMSSKEIAERLSLSVRTIDNQLARVYTALGVTRRAELAARLGPGLDP